MSVLARMARLSGRCPSEWRFTRGVSEPWHHPEVIRHLETCADCADQYESLRELLALARSLPAPGPLLPESRRAITGNLWGSVPQRTAGSRRYRWGLVVAVAAMAAMAAGALLALAVAALRPEEPRARPPQVEAQSPPSSRVAIRAFGDARFSRAQAASDEIVRLYAGRISLDVTPLRANERFRVVTDDAVVEVRGASCELTALAGSLARASVSRGGVEIKTEGAVAVLGAGDRWERAADSPSRVPTRAEGAQRKK